MQLQFLFAYEDEITPAPTFPFAHHILRDGRAGSGALQLEDFNLGPLYRQTFDNLNVIREEDQLPLLVRRDVIVPERVAEKLTRERLDKEGLDPDRFVQMVNSVIFNPEAEILRTRHPHIQGTYRRSKEGAHRVGYIAQNPENQDTILKSVYPIKERELRIKLSKKKL